MEGWRGGVGSKGVDLETRVKEWTVQKRKRKDD